MTTGALLSLFIVVPMVASGLATVIGVPIIRRALALAIPFAGMVGGLWLLSATSGDTPVLADNVGKFVGGISIPIVADSLTAVMIFTTSLVVFVALWFADVVGETRARFYPALALLLLGGAWGALLTADLFNLFVFIEVMLMPSFGLIAMTGTWARLASARMFIIVNLVTSLLLVSGVALTYGVIGTTNIAALAGAAGPRGQEFEPGVFGNQWQLVVTLGLVILALSVKAGVTPVHTWLPRAYPSTSPAVMALFSGLHTKVAVYAILRIFMTIFEGDPTWSWTILFFMVLGMLIGGFGGMVESSMRSVIGYQMVNGIPFILISLAFLAEKPHLMLSAALFYMLHHMVVAAALIMASGAIEETYGFGRLRLLSGIMRRDRFVATVFAMGALAIVGFPPFSGLWGKLGLVFGISADGSWRAWLAISVIIISSMAALLSMVYLWREVFWGRQMNANECDPTLRVPRRYVFPSAALIAVSVTMFVGAGPLFNVTNRAAHALTDTTAYVAAVFPDKDKAVGNVLPIGPAGLDNVPEGAQSATASNAVQEEENRKAAKDPKQYDATNSRVDSPQREKAGK
ncbi:monovalent cation/H+ antiporter subunit D family protein [Corynebacterium sp. zg254]|uniref:monovalent cation/H+ antiporter subunit D family protein n=1 Tax=Corynebacterium sp. zg254 TaxID=2656645 RepID=UPI002150C85E|nr:monovalent cation/H+ antiporter subunit D family protein [Corynebacterium sp. zg254]MCR5914333.1 monovalent cation/H+ antiporter subunit D family protein [Corynebacterium sp. zg254]